MELGKNINYADENILIVDDEQDFGKILLELITHRGFKAHYVSDGEKALEALKSENSYTFLIADIIMPGINGLELTKKVSEEYPHISAIIMTGYSNGHKYVDVINSGAIDFINKPFRIEEIEAKICRGIIERNTRDELKRLTITDSLTGLYNQRHFYSKLKEEIIRSQRQDQKLALILMDLDSFKAYNDTNGHIAGDELLQYFGKIIKKQIRQGVDSGYRYGGDEFAIILGDSDDEICLEIQKRIEKALKDECNVCVSMGHASYAMGLTAEQFVAHADKELYILKEKKKTSPLE